jgi:hypothetical protein
MRQGHQRHEWLPVQVTRLSGPRGYRLREWFYCPWCRRFTDTYGRYGRIRVPPCDRLQGEYRQQSIFPLFDPNDAQLEAWLASITYAKEHQP